MLVDQIVKIQLEMYHVLQGAFDNEEFRSVCKRDLNMLPLDSKLSSLIPDDPFQVPISCAHAILHENPSFFIAKSVLPIFLACCVYNSMYCATGNLKTHSIWGLPVQDLYFSKWIPELFAEWLGYSTPNSHSTLASGLSSEHLHAIAIIVSWHLECMADAGDSCFPASALREFLSQMQ